MRSSGRIRTSFRIILGTQLLAIIAVLVAAKHGLVWVAAATASMSMVQFCIYQIVGQRMLNIRFIEFARVYGKNMLITGATLMPSLAVMLIWGNAPFALLLNVATLVLVTGLAWIAAIWLLKSPLLGELVAVLSHIKAWRRQRLSRG